MTGAQYGVGLQLNPTMLEDFGLEKLSRVRYDFAQLLCDNFAGPLDSAYVIDPPTRSLMEQVMATHQVIAHGNYGAEFSFEPLELTPAVNRHIQVTHAMQSPWYCDHMLFGDMASSYMWSQPLQFSKQEVIRVADRAAKLQDLLKLPLLHENAFYYARFPGSTIAEAEFLAELITRAGTHMLLDLHNVFANDVNTPGYDRWQFLRTIPLDRVVEIHIAGGQHLEDWYHDLHNNHVPDEVYEMLDWVLPRAPNLRAITLEAQGPEHTPMSRAVDDTWLDMIDEDMRRARALWDKHERSRTDA